MEEMEQRVWQRVKAAMPEGQTETALHGFALAAEEAIADYSRRLQRSSGRQRELLWELLKLEEENLNSICGLHYLQTGSGMRKRRIPGTGNMDSRGLVLRYHTARKLLAEYTARSAQPEWGCVFQAMARRQEQQCDLLARLMGLETQKIGAR